jgi:hypothetical protein
MLLEEQAAELVQRCERILGIALSQTRGNLRTADNRAAAVWELLVIEAASSLIDRIRASPGASPDVRLDLARSCDLVEVAYLYPRFWDEERRSNAVVAWLSAEANVAVFRVQAYPRLDGIPVGRRDQSEFYPSERTVAFSSSPSSSSF